MALELPSSILEAAKQYKEIEEALNKHGIYSTSAQAVIALAVLNEVQKHKVTSVDGKTVEIITPQIDYEALAKIIPGMDIDYKKLAVEISQIYAGLGGLSNQASHQESSIVSPGSAIRVPYTIVSADLNASGDSENDVKYLNAVANYLVSNGWNPKNLWMAGGKIRNDFSGKFMLTADELDELSNNASEDEDNYIRLYFKSNSERFPDSALEVFYSVADSSESAVMLTTYHSEFEQGLHSIKAFGEYDKWAMVELMNGMMKNIESRSDGYDRSDIKLIVTTDLYSVEIHE